MIWIKKVVEKKKIKDIDKRIPNTSGLIRKTDYITKNNRE